MSEYGLKRHFNGDCAREIAHMLGSQSSLDVEAFACAVDSRIGDLELKDRVLVITEELRSRLGGEYLEVLELLVRSLGQELREDQGMFTESWYLMPVARFVEEYGTEHPVESLAAIEEITKRHTGEYAIRPYLRQWHELTMEAVRRWSQSPSHNVRRLASEGIRPRLPWASQYKPFIDDPTPVIGVIDALVNDPSLYVRTSVANNLNDVSKDHPELAVTTAKRWLRTSDTDRTRWIVRKGLRTLIKKGYPPALEAVGAEADPHVSIKELSLDPSTPRIGESAQVSAVVVNEGPASREVIVDYQVHFLRPDGSLRPNTFKLGRVRLSPGERAEVSKRHSFKEVKTRTLHAGAHILTAQANGKPSSEFRFTLNPR